MFQVHTSGVMPFILSSITFFLQYLPVYGLCPTTANVTFHHSRFLRDECSSDYKMYRDLVSKYRTELLRLQNISDIKKEEKKQVIDKYIPGEDKYVPGEEKYDSEDEKHVPGDVKYDSGEEKYNPHEKKNVPGEEKYEPEFSMDYESSEDDSKHDLNRVMKKEIKEEFNLQSFSKTEERLKEARVKAESSQRAASSGEEEVNQEKERRERKRKSRWGEGPGSSVLPMGLPGVAAVACLGGKLNSSKKKKLSTPHKRKGFP